MRRNDTRLDSVRDNGFFPKQWLYSGEFSGCEHTLVLILQQVIPNGWPNSPGY